MDTVKRTKTKCPNARCCIDTTKGVKIVAAIQISHGILYLLYSIITWVIDSFIRVRSNFETYYAYGQPAVTTILGLTLLITIIVVTTLNVTVAICSFWTLVQTVLIGMTIYRLTKFSHTDSYISTFEQHKSYVLSEIIVSVVIILLQCYEVVMVIRYLCDRSRRQQQYNGDPFLYLVEQRVVMPVQYSPMSQKMYTPSYPSYPIKPLYGRNANALGMTASGVHYGYHDDYYVVYGNH